MLLEQVAFDIETTGFDVEDEVTVVGFELSMGGARVRADSRSAAR